VCISELRTKLQVVVLARNRSSELDAPLSDKV
jgi:hypothetical protein